MNTLVQIFEQKFLEIHRNSRLIVEKTPDDFLYKQATKTETDFPFHSVGGNILRSAGAIEQTFGGITVRLWDDPFEWTLPEELKNRAKILEYLDETDATRRRGFALFKSDDDLRREIPAPDVMKNIFQILVETIARAENFQGRAIGIYNSLN